MKLIFTLRKFRLIAILVFCAFAAVAQPPGWQYSVPYHVTENSGTTLNNYQVRLNLNTQALIAAGQLNADGSDLRFSVDCGAGAVFLDYFIESGLNTTTTTIWIKIPVILANSTISLYMFHGNPAATPMSNISLVLEGPMSSTDSVASGAAGGVGNSQRGFRFGVTEDILVTAFGKREPTGTTRYVTLFDFNTQAILTQTQVAGPAAQFSYSNLTNPIRLIPGNQYLLELYQDVSDGYYFGTSSQVGQELIYYDMRYCNSCTQNTFPTNTLTNYHYGTPDFWYYVRQHATVEPTVTNAPSFVADAGTDQTICQGDPATLTASGGASYVWSTTEITAAISVTPANTTTYIVTVADIAGCTDTASVSVIVNQLPVANAGADQAVCVGSSATLTATGGSDYEWNTTETTNSITVTPANTATYTVTVTDANTCSNTATVTVNVNGLPNAGAGNNQDVCAGSSATLTATGGVSYEWNTSATTASITVTPVNSAAYTVTVTDANTCSNTATVTVNVNALPAASAGNNQDICAGSSITLTATGGIDYNWSTTETTSAITVTPANTATYTVTVTDANTCSNTATVTITVNALPAASAGNNQDVCAGSSATLTATGGTDYVWSTTETTASITVTPSNAATYTVTVTDANTCSNTATATVNVNALPVAGAGNNQDVCTGSSATLTATGGTDYEWSTTETTASITVTPANTATYTVTVTDANTCSNTATVTVNVNTLPAASAGSNQDICEGSSSTLTATGGTHYEWSTTETTASITVTPVNTATYTVTVTDNNTCSNTASVIVNVGSLPNVSAGNDQDICAGESANLTATGGANYEWSTTETAASITVTPANTSTYTVTVTDNNSCSNTASVVVNVNALPVASAGNDVTICNGTFANLTASGGTDYVWNTTETAATITVSPTNTATYDVTVTDNNSCSATAQVTVTVNAVPVISLTADTAICTGNAVQLSASGGTGYAWSSNETTAQIDVTPGATTTYTVTVTDGNNCSASAETEVVVNSLPTVPVISVSGSVLTSTTADSYLWYKDGSAVSSATSQTFTLTGAGTYAVEITDNNGCSNTSADFVYTGISSPVATLGNVSIYPSPTTGLLNINMGGKTDLMDVKIVSVTGAVIVKSQFSGKTSFDLSSYAAGVYTVYISGNGGNYNQRIILNQ